MNMQATVAGADDAAPMPAAFLVEREALTGPLDFLNRIVERRNCIPILANLLIQPTEDGQLRLSATNLDVQAAFVIDAAWEAPGSLTVPAAMLRDVVRKMPKGSQVTFTYDADSARLIVTAGRVRNTLATLPVDDMPVIAFDGTEARRCALPAATLARDLAALSPAMSKEERRYYLQGVAIQHRAGDLVMVATDGAQMAYVTRPAPEGLEALSLIVPSATVALLVRRLNTKGLEPGDVDCEFLGDGKARFSAQGFTLVTKLIDGTFPDWVRAQEIALGEEALQKVAMIELHPALAVGKIAALAKAAGVELEAYTGEKAAMLCSPAYPEFRAVSMFLKEGEGDKNFGFNRYHSARDHAERYAAALAEAAGLTPLASCYSTYEGGLITGVTFGEWETVTPEPVEHVCYETLTTRMEYPESYRVYQDGAFSIAIPRSHGALVTVAMDGDVAGAQPVRTNEKGELQLSEAAVRALAGDVAEFPRVDIPRLTCHHGEIIAIDGIATDGTGRCVVAGEPMMTSIPGRKRPKKLSDRDAILYYCRDPKGVMAALQPRYYRAPDDAAPAEIVAEPVQVAPVVVDIEIPAEEIVATGSSFDTPPAAESNVIVVDFQPPAETCAETQVEPEPAASEPVNIHGASDIDALRAENEALRTKLDRLEGWIVEHLAGREAAAPVAAPEPIVIEATFDAYGRSYSTPIIAGFNVQPDQAERIAELERELLAAQGRGDILSTAIDAARETMADVRQRGDEWEAKAASYLNEAQVNAERAVAAEIALAVAQEKLARFGPLIAAASGLPPMPMTDTGDGLRVAASV